MANTYVDYVGNGSETDFNFSFPYIKTSHVAVEVNEGPAGGTNRWVRTTDFTVQTSPTTFVRFNSAPANLVKVRVLRDSDASIGIVDFANGSVLTETELDNAYEHNRYLAEEAEEGITGGALVKNPDTGQFNADALRLENLADPDSDDDAVNKGYADGRYVDEAGDSMSGNLTMDSPAKVIQVQAPSGGSDLTNKTYVDGEVSTEAAARIAGDNLQVTKAGDSMSGDLTMTSPAKVVQAAAPTNANDLTNKDYVDGVVADGDALKVNKSGDTMTGALTLPGVDPSDFNHATRKRYVDQQIAVAVSSGNPGGPIDTANITDGAITTAKIDDGAVTTAKIDDGAVTTNKIDNRAVTTAKLDNASVTTAKIEDDAVTAAKLDHTSVTPGSYTNTDITVDENGRITAASSGAAGGEDNVQADWNETNNTSDAFIQNKPTLGTAAAANTTDFAAASHTHTAANITNFDTEVANNTAVAANTAKVSNATHTGDVTGSTTLTIANNAVTGGKIANGSVTPAKTNFDKLEIDAATTSEGDGGYGTVEMFGVNGAYIDLKNAYSEDYDARIISGTVTNSILELHGKLGTKLNTGSGNTTAVYAHSNNKVRIGDANTPAYALDVNGDVNVTGNFKVNGTNVASQLQAKASFQGVSSVTRNTAAETNIASVTRTGTGAYTVTFTNAVTDPVVSLAVGWLNGTYRDRSSYLLKNSSGTTVYSGSVASIDIATADAGSARDATLVQLLVF